MKKIFVNRSWLEARIQEAKQQLKQKSICQKQQKEAQYRLNYLTEKYSELIKQPQQFIEINNQTI